MKDWLNRRIEREASEKSNEQMSGKRWKFEGDEKRNKSKNERAKEMKESKKIKD